MTDAARILGSAPPKSWDSVKAGLVRLRRDADMDDEERNSSSAQRKLVSYALIVQLDALLDWIEPAVRDEEAMWDVIDADFDRHKEGA